MHGISGIRSSFGLQLPLGLIGRLIHDRCEKRSKFVSSWWGRIRTRPVVLFFGTFFEELRSMDASQVDPIVGTFFFWLEKLRQKFYSGTWWHAPFIGGNRSFSALRPANQQHTTSRTSSHDFLTKKISFGMAPKGVGESLDPFIQFGGWKVWTEIFKPCNWWDCKIFHSGWMALIWTNPETLKLVQLVGL